VTTPDQRLRLVTGPAKLGDSCPEKNLATTRRNTVNTMELRNNVKIVPTEIKLVG
jgi:hypothetical protein